MEAERVTKRPPAVVLEARLQRRRCQSPRRSPAAAACRPSSRLWPRCSVCACQQRWPVEVG